jgi:protease-4
MMAPPAKKGGGALTRVLGGLLVSLLLISLGANLYMGFLLSQLFAGPSEAQYEEGTHEDRVVILPVVGGIDGAMEQHVRRSLDALHGDDAPAGIVLRIESGGGGVTASDQIWHHITRYRQANPDVPVVASFGGVAASGGYYIATPCDEIVAETTGITGSIGVMAYFPTVEGLVESLGIEVNTIAADGSDEKLVANNLFEAWHNEQGELTEAGRESRQVILDLINASYERFVDVVDQGRPGLDEAAVRQVADGSVYTAQEALSNGLVDHVGYLSDAVDRAAALAGIPSGETPRVTIIRPQTSLFGGPLGSRVAVERPSINLEPETVRTWLTDFAQLRLEYRMQLTP